MTVSSHEFGVFLCLHNLQVSVKWCKTKQNKNSYKMVRYMDWPELLIKTILEKLD